jgi:ABC-2 type transport system permease protein
LPACDSGKSWFDEEVTVLERIKHMLIKEFLQTFRDPRMRTVILIMPIIQSLVFGYAVTTDITAIPTGVYDLDQTRESRELISRFLGSGYFRAAAHIIDDGQARVLMDRGEVRLVLHLRKGFGGDVRAGRPAPVQLIVDGTDSNTAGIVLSYSAMIIGDHNEKILLTRTAGLAGRQQQQPLELAARSWFNPNFESRYYYVPGVIALIVMLITLMLGSMAVVREKEIGTIEQIMVTPITRFEFILGKTLPFAMIGYLNVILITVIAVFWFQVPLRGNLLLLFAANGFYLMCTLGLGLLISTVSSTQQQAMMSAFFIYFPAVLLSGFMFPIANMPEVIQWLTYLNPLRYFLVIIRGIFLKGIGPEFLWPQMAALAALGFLLLSLAVSRFRKTIT